MIFMQKKLSSQELLARWEDRRACQNIAGKFSHSYTIHEEEKIYDRFWSRREDVCLGLNNGWYAGAQAVQGYYNALGEKKALETRLICQRFPEELGQYTQEEASGVGILGYKPVDTCVLEVAGNGETAKGLWICRGASMDLTSCGFVLNTEWSYLAIDFIHEDGQWKIWHLQNLFDVFTPMGYGWAGEPTDFTEAPEFAEMKSFSMPEPNIPTTLREYYHPMREFSPSPPLPEPYYDFAETFTYGIEEVQA
jgi:hypothetical protein